jgi:hypothetical protein
MNESFLSSILATDDSALFDSIELMLENSEYDAQACRGKDFVPGEWDVVSLVYVDVCLLAATRVHFDSTFHFRPCNSLCNGTCSACLFNRYVEEEKSILTTLAIVVFGS